MAEAPIHRVLEDGVIELAVHAQPGAGRSQVAGRHGNALKVRVAAPPEGGRANEALADLLAETFGAERGKVELVAGDTSRTKRFRLAGLDPDAFARRLDDVVADATHGPGPAARRGRQGPSRPRA